MKNTGKSLEAQMRCNGWRLFPKDQRGNSYLFYCLALHIIIITRWALSGLECWKAEKRGKKRWKGRRWRAWDPGGWRAPAPPCPPSTLPPPPSTHSGSLLRAQSPTTDWGSAAVAVEEGKTILTVNLPPNVSSSSSVFSTLVFSFEIINQSPKWSLISEITASCFQKIIFGTNTIIVIIGIKESIELA